MSKFYFTIILLIFVPSLAVSQPQDFQFEHFTVKDGLSHNTVRSILQDRQGFMWFGTDQGLNKFDGYHFTVYKNMPEDTSGISAGWVPCLFEDSEGFIWIGTGSGLNKFDPRTEKFRHYFHDDKRSESLSHNNVTCILEDRVGYIWIGTYHGLNRFDRKTGKFKHFIHEPDNPISISLDFISCLHEDSQGDLWIGTGTPLIYDETSGGINKFDRKTEMFISFKFEPNRFGYTNLISDIDEDASGNLWVATGFGLRVFNRNRNAFTNHYHYDASSILSLSRNTIKSVLVDSKNNIWFGSCGGGLNRLDKITGESIQYHNNPQDGYSLSYDKVSSICKDRNGCLWIGTEGSGIDKINLHSSFFQHYRKDISEEKMQQVYDVNNVRSVYEDRAGRVWFGSEGEINILDRSASVNNWTTIQFIHRGTFVQSIVEDDAGIFWIGIAHGLIRYDPIKKQQKWYTFSESGSAAIMPFLIHTLLIDQEGILWIGTHQGLYRFDRQNGTYTRFVRDPEQMNTLGDNRVFSILEDSPGFLWIGTARGLNKFDPAKQAFLNSQIDEQAFDQLSHNDLRVMCEDQSGNLWIGTSFGLKLFDRRTGKLRLFTQQDGLPDNVICGLIADDRGKIWISTYNGLSRYNPATNEFKSYYLSDGLRNTTFNSRASFKNKNGELFFGGTNGLTVFHPDSLKDNPHPPKIVLTDFKINYESVKIGPDSPLKKSITFTDTIKLAYDQNFISFEFAALDYTSPKKNLYAYKLEGINPGWVHTDAAYRIAAYTNLHPGRYIFRVKGSNNDGVWNEEGASVRIIIMPPWWKTPWAYASYVALFIALVLGIFRFEVNRYKRQAEERLRQEQERRRLEAAEHRAVVAELQAQAAEAQKEIEKEQMRSRIASDLHDEIGSNLSSIALISQMLTQKLKLVGPERKKLKEIPRIARFTAESMRDIIWFINPENDDMDKLILKMKQTANLMLEQIDFKFNVPKKGIPIETDLNFRRNLFLIYKEILQNILRHAHATQVEISISPVDGYFRLQVIDNGVGFDPTASYPGNGLKNFRRRAKETGGELQIQSQKNEGTTITLTVKIP